MAEATWAPDEGAAPAKSTINLKAAAAECVATTLFVIIGCGTACSYGASDGPTRFVVANAFGMGIMVLAYAFGHHSGGQINCAVTLSLVVGGELPWYQGVANTIGQLVGSLTGAGILSIIFHDCSLDHTKSLGTNIVNEKYGPLRALFGEFAGTFLLCYVVWETAVSHKASAGRNACIAIGFAVFLAHLVLLPIDGCSINPSRSFGPAILGSLRDCGSGEKGLADLWVMWVGPLLGAIAAAVAKGPFLKQD